MYKNEYGLYQIFWIDHTNKNVYGGTTHESKYKVTYHESGKRHVYIGKKREIQDAHHELNKFKGLVQILSSSFENRKNENLENLPFFKPFKKEALNKKNLLIDGVSIGDKKTISLFVGLLEPNAFGTLKQFIEGHPVATKQLVRTININTDVNPWLLSVLFW